MNQSGREKTAAMASLRGLQHLSVHGTADQRAQAVAQLRHIGISE